MPPQNIDSYKPQFEITRRGYDREAVDAHIDWLIKTYDQARREHEELKARLGELQQELDAYRGLEQRVGNALLLAEGAAADVRAKAEQERSELVGRARREADALLSDAREERRRLADEIERLQSLRAELVSSYRAFLLSALEVLEDAPSEEPPASQEGHPAEAPAA